MFTDNYIITHVHFMYPPQIDPVVAINKSTQGTFRSKLTDSPSRLISGHTCNEKPPSTVKHGNKRAERPNNSCIPVGTERGTTHDI